MSAVATVILIALVVVAATPVVWWLVLTVIPRAVHHLSRAISGGRR